MTITGSEITVIPKRFSGLRVLLVEHDESSLKYHAYMLSQNSYQVTPMAEASTGLSMILKGHIYDCVLADADMREMDATDFLRQILECQPHLSIIMMASGGIYLQIAKKAQENEAILCLLKPCGFRDICNIWQHICRKIMASHDSASHGKSPEENRDHSIVKGVDRMVKPPAVLNKTMVNNSISSGNNTQQGLNTNLQEYGTMLKARITWTPALHCKFLEALNSVGNRTYPSAILKKMNVPDLTRAQVASHLQKYKVREKINRRVGIAPPMQRGDYSLVECYAGKRPGQSTPFDSNASINRSSSLSTSPLTLNATGTSYMALENIKDCLQQGSTLPMEQLTTTTTTKNSSDGGGSSAGHVNEVQMTGYGYENAMESLLRGVTSSDHAFGEAMATLGANSTEALDYDLGMDVTNFLHGLDVSNFGGASGGGVSEAQEPHDGCGNAMEPWVTGKAYANYDLGAAMEPLGVVAVEGANSDLGMSGTSNSFEKTNSSGGGGGGGAASSNHGAGDLALPEFLPCDSDLLQNQDFQGYGENWLPVSPHPMTPSTVENFINPSFDSLDSAHFDGLGSVDFSLPCSPREENNIQAPIQLGSFISSLDGSAARVTDNASSLNQNDQYDLEMIMELLDEADIHLINLQQ